MHLTLHILRMQVRLEEDNFAFQQGDSAPDTHKCFVRLGYTLEDLARLGYILEDLARLGYILEDCGSAVVGTLVLDKMTPVAAFHSKRLGNR